MGQLPSKGNLASLVSCLDLISFLIYEMSVMKFCFSRLIIKINSVAFESIQKNVHIRNIIAESFSIL